MKNMHGLICAFTSTVVFLLTANCYAEDKTKSMKANKERLEIFHRIWEICAIKFNDLDPYSSAEVVKVTPGMKYGQPDGTEIVRVKATTMINGRVAPEKFEMKIKSDFSAFRKALFAPNFDFWIGKKITIGACFDNFNGSYAKDANYDGLHSKGGWYPK